MIAHLRGTILHHTIDRVILDVQGVGYEIWVPTGTQGRLLAQVAEDEVIGVHVYTNVREDALQLFGFASQDEKRVFERLLTVSGIGPKLALAILSALEPLELLKAVETNDLSALTKVSGVGKKTGQRLILELKSKFDDFALEAISPTEGASGGLIEDLRSALQNLGYGEQLIDGVVTELRPRRDEFDGVDEMLREAFKMLR